MILQTLDDRSLPWSQFEGQVRLVVNTASKFARAFRDVIGVSPNEYRSGVDQDSCAP